MAERNLLSNLPNTADIRPISAGNLTPAIETLLQATQAGAITADNINRHFSKGVEQARDIDASATATVKDRLERDLAPKIAQAKKELLDLEAEIRPLQGAVTKGDLNAKLASQDFAKRLEPDTQDAEITKRYVDQVRRSLVSSAAASDPTGANLSIFDAYTATGRPPIFKADKTLDFDKMAQETLGTGKASEELDKVALTHNVNPFAPDGSRKTRQQLYAEISSASVKPKPLTAEQRAEEVASINMTDQTLRQMKDATAILFEKDAAGNVVRNPDGSAKVASGNVTGPVSGTAPGKILSAALSVFGGKTYDKQRQLEMLHNEIVREKTSALKGPLSEKELKFLEKSVPGLGDNEAVWDKYLSEFIPLMENSLNARRRNLESAATGATGPATPAPAVSATPAPPGAIAPTDPRYQELSRTARRPASAAELSRLREGDPYIFQGHLLVW